ncbi:MAG: phosphomannomutase, partial [Nitrospira sp.]|nr:phosphomannomutase [Nitrospira sp.]
VTIDGVRAIFHEGWGLIRASNTQPALVLRFEATSLERLNTIRAVIEGELALAKQALGC